MIELLKSHPLVVWTCLILAVLIVLYLQVLPKPIPGIPYNEKSSKSLLGDVPTMIAHQKSGQRARNVWVDMIRAQKSPIMQFFGGPFTRPTVILSDFTAIQDLFVKKAKLLDKGPISEGLWAGAIPHHFIGMNARDARYTATRELSKDLMTPSFLHNVCSTHSLLVSVLFGAIDQVQVSVPASYDKVLNFIQLWEHKASIAQGRPFDAIQDLNFLTSDIILAAALGISNEESDTVLNLNALKAISPEPSPSPSDKIFPFPEPTSQGLLQCVLDIGAAIGGCTTAPSFKAYWFLTNLRPSIRRIKAQRAHLLRTHIDRAHTRVLHNQTSSHHSAVDYIVSRELLSAQKSLRPPNLSSPTLHDALFGYILGGQDTTHSVLAFLLKRLAANPSSQTRLRDSLRTAHPTALAENRLPSAEEIIHAAKIPYLNAFIEECMRLDSPAPVLTKETLEEVEVLGYKIPKGCDVVCTLWGPSIDEPAFQVPGRHIGEKRVPVDWMGSGYAPGEFWPERWIKNEGGEERFDIRAGPTLSFGVGPRECWGRRLAYLELRLVVTLLVWKFGFGEMEGELKDDWEAVDVLNAKPKRCFVRLTMLD